MESDIPDRAKSAAMYAYLSERFPEGLSEEEYVPVTIQGHHFDVSLHFMTKNVLTFDLYYQGHEYVWRSFEVYPNGEVLEEELVEDEEADDKDPQVHGPDINISSEEIVAAISEGFEKAFPLH